MSFDPHLPPSLVLMIGGLLLPLFFRMHRGMYLIAVLFLPVLTMADIWTVPENAGLMVHFAGFDISPLTIHPFTYIFSTAFALAAFAGGLFGMRQARVAEMAAAYVYAGGAIGVTFAGDFITLFLHWEAMAVASTIVVLCGGTIGARRAAYRYAILHFIGGAFLLAGITAHFYATGTITLAPFTVEWADWLLLPHADLETIAAWGLLIGVMINLAAPPFSAWLADAYPEASPTGTVFLSAFTTKTAVFVLLTLFAGKTLLVSVGIFMIFYGIVWAMLENNMRRILAYSIVNQVGFMVTGIGIGTPLALLGVAAHAFCHIIYKALLMMSAGSVVWMTGKHKCSEVGGLYRTMPLTTICGTIGALAISAFPLTSGFISKSMINSAAGEAGLMVPWFLLVAASAGVFLHAGIKFPWFVFFQKDSGLRPADPPMNMRLAMLFLAILCILPGIFPEMVYRFLPVDNVSYHPNTAEHIVTQLQLLLFAGLAFFVALPWLKRTETITLDLDWFYRKLLLGMVQHIAAVFTVIYRGILWVVSVLSVRVNHQLKRWCGPYGPFGRSWALGDTALYSAALLGGILLIYYLQG